MERLAKVHDDAQVAAAALNNSHDEEMLHADRHAIDVYHPVGHLLFSRGVKKRHCLYLYLYLDLDLWEICLPRAAKQNRKRYQNFLSVCPAQGRSQEATFRWSLLRLVHRMNDAVQHHQNEFIKVDGSFCMFLNPAFISISNQNIKKKRFRFLRDTWSRPRLFRSAASRRTQRNAHVPLTSSTYRSSQLLVIG